MTGSIIKAIRRHAQMGTEALCREIPAGEALPPFDDAGWDDHTVDADDLAELLTSAEFRRLRVRANPGCARRAGLEPGSRARPRFTRASTPRTSVAGGGPALVS